MTDDERYERRAQLEASEDVGYLAGLVLDAEDRIAELEAAVDDLLGHARCESDCDRVVDLSVCNCGSQQAVRSAAALLASSR